MATICFAKISNLWVKPHNAINQTTLGRMEGEINAINQVTLARMEAEIKDIRSFLDAINQTTLGRLEQEILEILAKQQQDKV